MALDLSGRSFVLHEVDVPAETIGTFDTGLVEDFVRAFAQAAELTVHVRLRSGRSPHHVVEAEFKALAKALGDACSPTGRDDVRARRGRCRRRDPDRRARLRQREPPLGVPRARARGAEPW